MSTTPVPATSSTPHALKMLPRETAAGTPKGSDDEALVFFATFLARERDYDLLAMSARSARWYQEQVGAEVCTLERAARMRLFALDACRSHRLRIFEQNRLAGRDRVQMGVIPFRASRRLSVTVACMAIVAIFTVVLAVVGWAK